MKSWRRLLRLRLRSKRQRYLPRISLGLLPVQRLNARIIACETRVSMSALVYQLTVTDPVAYSGPWLAAFSFKASDTRMFASPCHEHNHSRPCILLGPGMADARAASN
jgi:hypothetical protein